MKTAEQKGSCTIPPGKATRWSFIVFGISGAVFGSAFATLWGFPHLWAAVVAFLTDYLRLAIALLVGMLLHELIHAGCFALFSKKGFRSVTLGINWKHFAPYASCNESLTVRQYAIATLMPGIVMGVLPCLYAVITGAGWFLVFGVFFTAGAASDFLSAADLSKLPRDARVTDHPDEAGFDWSIQ